MALADYILNRVFFRSLWIRFFRWCLDDEKNNAVSSVLFVFVVQGLWLQFSKMCIQHYVQVHFVSFTSYRFCFSCFVFCIWIASFQSAIFRLAIWKAVWIVIVFNVCIAVEWGKFRFSDQRSWKSGVLSIRY